MTDSFDFLDNTVEDLADLPEFKPFPKGSYKFLFDWEPFKSDDKENKSSGIKLKLSFQEVLELADPEATPPAEGRKLTLSLFARKRDGSKNEFGEGQIKMVASALKETFGGALVRETLDAAAGATVAVTLKTRANPKDPEAVFNELVEFAVAD